MPVMSPDSRRHQRVGSSVMGGLRRIRSKSREETRTLRELVLKRAPILLEPMHA